MKITVVYDSMEEFLRYTMVDGSLRSTITHYSDEAMQAAKEKEKRLRLDMDKLAYETAKLPEAQEGPKQAQEEAEDVKAEEPARAPEKPQKIDESLRVEVRKMLATLNKMQTGNPVKQLISATGYKRLTDVPLELLPDLKKKAEEALNNA